NDACGCIEFIGPVVTEFAAETGFLFMRNAQQQAVIAIVIVKRSTQIQGEWHRRMRLVALWSKGDQTTDRFDREVDPEHFPDALAPGTRSADRGFGTNRPAVGTDG